MPLRRLRLLHVLLLLAYANPASADRDPDPLAVTNPADKGLDQIVYKGFVGNALDGVAMDPSKRVSLQRTNAIVSNTLSGRTLAALAGLSNPVLLIGGLAWGVWSASNIKPEETGALAISYANQAAGEMAARENQLVLLDALPVAKGPLIAPQTAIRAEPSVPAAAVGSHSVRSSVVKIWLPQRPSN
jgi:hypothetical protein